MDASLILRTERLLLRGFELSDAPEVERLAGEREIAATTINIPHPYPPGAARDWIQGHVEQLTQRKALTLAIVRTEHECLIGSVSLMGWNDQFSHAELGYWIGKPYWACGYASEAARAVVDHGFGVLGLHRIHAHHFAGNPASGRVLTKIGMTREGRCREHVYKWGEFHDIELYGILRQDWQAM